MVCFQFFLQRYQRFSLKSIYFKSSSKSLIQCWKQYSRHDLHNKTIETCQHQIFGKKPASCAKQCASLTTTHNNRIYITQQQLQVYQCTSHFHVNLAKKKRKFHPASCLHNGVNALTNTNDANISDKKRPTISAMQRSGFYYQDWTIIVSYRSWISSGRQREDADARSSGDRHLRFPTGM